MGCGCGGGGRGSSSVRRGALRPSVGPKSIRGQSAAGASPAQLRALGMQSAQSMQESKKLNTDRRRIDKLRRQAIRRKLGR